MSVTHLPSAAQRALRVEALATFKAIQALLNERRPSTAASSIALVGVFSSLVLGAADRGATDAGPEAAFRRTLELLVGDEFLATAEDVAAATRYATGDELPPNTEDVLVDLRAQAVRGASSL